MEKISGDFLVEIHGVQDVDGELNETDVITEGKYFKKGENICVSYTEYDPENPEFFYNTMVRYASARNTVTVFHYGENSSQLIFEKEQRHHCCYNTPFGALMMGVYTGALTADLNADGGKIYVSYTLDFNSELMSKNEITIKIKRKGL